MTFDFTLGELRLLCEALEHCASHHESIAWAKPRAAAMRALRRRIMRAPVIGVEGVMVDRRKRGIPT